MLALTPFPFCAAEHIVPFGYWSVAMEKSGEVFEAA